MTISKKLLMLISVLMTAMFTSSVWADGYRSLEFTMTNGETYIVGTNNLEFVIEGDNLTFNNSDFVLPVSSLMSMEFTDHFTGSSGINVNLFNTSGKIEVYTIDGKNLGEFNSCSDAIGSLARGIYVIKDSKGNSLKIKVGK